MTTTPRTVTSADGSRIAFEQTGDGPPVILVGGAFNDRTTVAELAATLAPDLTAIAHDRRGRGDSGDSPDYTLQREVEDLAALIDHAGGSASVFGHSSGGLLALEAARQGLAIDKLVIYEPPLTEPGRRSVLDRLRVLVKEDRRDEAAALFFTEHAGVPEAMISDMRAGPMWAWFAGLAHTLPYDVEICETVRLESLATITVRTLTIGGGDSPPGLPEAARAVAETIPGARYLVLDGHDHSVLQRPADLRPILLEFLA